MNEPVVENGQDNAGFDQSFEEGFAIEEDTQGTPATDNANTETASQQGGTANAEPEQQVPFDNANPAETSVQPLPEKQSTPEPVPVKTLENVPEAIRDEFENLKKLNPDAAVLAMEDSPEGAAIRSRLENYGAEVAQDRAERLLERRNFARESAEREQAQI